MLSLPITTIYLGKKIIRFIIIKTLKDYFLCKTKLIKKIKLQPSLYLQLRSYKAINRIPT